MSNPLELSQQHFDTALESPDLPAGKAGGIKKLRELILTLAMQENQSHAEARRARR